MTNKHGLPVISDRKRYHGAMPSGLYKRQKELDVYNHVFDGIVSAQFIREPHRREKLVKSLRKQLPLTSQEQGV